MSNLARNHFDSTDEASTVLKYRSVLKWNYLALLGIGLVGSAFFAIGIVSALYRGNFAAASWLSVTATLTSGMLLAQARYLYKPLAFSTVEVKKDRLVLVRMGTTIVIPYDEIAAVEIKHITYTAGWYKLVLKNKKSYRFTLMLEHSEKILDAIRAAKPELIKPSEYATYKRIAVFTDHQWQRFSELKQGWLGLSVRLVALPLIQMIVMTAVKPSTPWWGHLTLFAVINMIIGFVLHTGLSILAIRQFSRRWNEKTLHAERDPVQERALVRQVFAIHIVTSLLVMAYVLNRFL